jgi:hypothetical protein
MFEGMVKSEKKRAIEQEHKNHTSIYHDIHVRLADPDLHLARPNPQG